MRRSERKRGVGQGADVGKAPAETSTVVHLNAAGAAIPSPATLAKVHQFLDDESRLGAYEMVSKHGKEDLERPYKELATLLNCDPEEISIVSSATEGWNEVVWGVARTLLRKGGTIVTTQCEYGSNYLTYLQIKEHFTVGDAVVNIHVLKESSPGEINVAELERLYHDPCYPTVKLVALPHVPTSSGVVYNLRSVLKALELGRVEKMGWDGKDPRMVYLVDATQSVGQLKVDVREIGCDCLVGTSRKWLRGPRGAGFVYCNAESRKMFEPATIDVHSARLEGTDSYTLNRGSRMFEKYEMSFAAKVGLGAAVAELNEAGIEHVARRVSGLAADLRGMLEKVAGVTVEDHGRTLCGIVSFTVDGKDGNADRERTERLFRELCAAGYSVSVSRRTSTPIDMAGRAIDCVIRVSPHVYNTEDELRNMVADVIDLLSKIPRY